MNENKHKLFRQQSIDALSSPDRINDYIRVTSPPVYLVLAALLVCCLAVVFWFTYGTVTEQVKLSGIVFPHRGTTSVQTPNEGVVSEIYTKRGRFVRQGEPLLSISSNGVPGVVNAPEAGVVLSYKNENESFKAYESIVFFMSQEDKMLNREVVAFVPYKELRKLEVGQEVQVTPSNLQREDYGYITGHIIAIDTYPMSREEAAGRFKLPQFADEIFPQATAYEVKIILDSHPELPDLPHWSRRKSQDIRVQVGTFCNLQIITRRLPVYQALFKNSENILHLIKEW